MTNHEPLVLNPKAADRAREDAELIKRGPATLVDILGVQAWSITHPNLLRELLTDDRVSKDPRQHYPAFDEVSKSWPLASWIIVENMFTAYGGEHRRLRKLVQPAFTARRTQAMVPIIEGIADELLSGLAKQAAQGQSVDLRAEFAYRLPIRVIFRLMGVPQSWEPRLSPPVDKVFSTAHSVEVQQANHVQLAGLLNEFVAYKQDRRDDDLTTVLIAARDLDETGLTDEQLADTLMLIISAGFETTVGLITNAARNLFAHPDELKAVTGGRAAWSDVVEETLRRDAPVAHLPLRYAVKDIKVNDDIVIKRGDAILASYGASGRHEDAHKDSDEFVVTRPDKAHLAFGHGVHLCIGAPLARAEATIALQQLFTRFPDAALAIPDAQLKPQESIISNSPAALPVHLGRHVLAETPS
ncbi:cytochrome P450 family protein [Streptomyces sp. NBC_01727]|uniref:cytochrome P450 family protein n=1 Tax=Streptomyces sp. NBC_01727 TaxID=2975924 RepID=UPI002E0F9EF5|nr:cytochrome P450 [Streptomyces sp. NBC_01727]